MFWTEDLDRVPSTMADSRGKLQFTPAEIKRIEAGLLATRDRLAACRIPFAVAIAPNKQSVYREFVIADGDRGPQMRFDGLLAGLSPAARSVIADLRDEEGQALAGVDVDLVQAHKWFNLAAVNGHDEAQMCRADISEEMTAREIAEAQRRAREWLSATTRKAA